MNFPLNLAIIFVTTCRRCGREKPIEVNSQETPRQDDLCRLVKAMRDHGLKRDGWAAGHCPVCLEHRFLDEADKADHDNKCQRELDP